MTDLTNLTARELAHLIRRKSVSPVEVMQATLARIEAQKELNAFITVTAKQALQDAKEAEAMVMAGGALPPLHGVPYSVKDLTLTAGVRTTMGSRLYADNIPKENALSVAKAKAAGAILIGKTTTPEFGHKQSASGPLFGQTLNPVNRRVTPGASSSGAAAAVAAGLGPLALGTDGGGSIRIPASCCGIVGMKPTLGNVGNLQPPDLFTANSYVGPMARDIADTALLYEVIRGGDKRDPFGQAPTPTGRPTIPSLHGVKVAWLPTAGNRIDPQVEQLTTAAVQAMADAGAEVEQIELDFVALEKHFLVLLESTLAARLGPQLADIEARLDPSLVATIRKGLQHSAVDLHHAGFARTQCFSQLQALFNRFDVLVSPTLSAPPLSLDVDVAGDIEIAGQNAGTIRGAWYPYTYPMNLTGHPALSMPCGLTTEGLPVGLQLVGRWHDDRYLLSVAHLVEQLLGA